MIKLINLLELGINSKIYITAKLLEEDEDYTMYDLNLIYKDKSTYFVGYKEDEFIRCPLDVDQDDFKDILNIIKLLKFNIGENDGAYQNVYIPINKIKFIYND